MIWDFNANNFAEFFDSTVDSGLNFTRAVFQNVSTTVVAGTTCDLPVNDTTNWNATLNNMFVLGETVSEGIVADEFLGSGNFYPLWRTPDMKTWVWVDPNTVLPVFVQIWRADLRRLLVLQITEVQYWPYFSEYDFQVW